MSTPSASGTQPSLTDKPTCVRPNCQYVVMNRGYCKKHYPLAYPAHLRGFTDTARAREHIAALRRRGVTMKMFHDEYGLWDSVIQRIERSDRMIRRATEAQVLAIPLPTAWLPTLVDVDATGSHRRLRALNAIGYTQEDIGKRIGVIQRHIAGILGRPRISSANAAKIAKVYQDLQLTQGPSEISRRRAKSRGWPPPLAWDEDSIDDPAAAPFTGTAPRVSTGERINELRDDLGITDIAEIAARLGIESKSVKRQLSPSRRIAS